MFFQPLGIGILFPVRLGMMRPRKSSYPSSVRTSTFPSEHEARCNLPANPQRYPSRLKEKTPILRPAGWTDHSAGIVWFVDTGQSKKMPDLATHGALTKGVIKSGSLGHKFVQVGRLGIGIPQSTQSIKSLLIGTNP